MGNIAWATDTADELIAENGKPVTFYREKKDVPTDDNMPWRPDGVLPDPPTKYNLTAVVIPYAEKFIDGTVVLRGDLNCLLASKGLDYEPRSGDYAQIGSKKFTVIKAEVLEPGVDRILYDIQLRG